VLLRVPRVLRRPLVPVVPTEPRAWLAAADETVAGAAAIPHTEQYPPSMVPPQPGCVQVAGPAAGLATVDGAAAGAAAIPHIEQYPPSMVPPQPGCVQVVAVVVIKAASAR